MESSSPKRATVVLFPAKDLEQELLKRYHAEAADAGMAAGEQTHHPAPETQATEGEEERVTPLEPLFDLVFVLAITQCTALMSHDPSWSGLAQGLLVLGMLWWAWATRG
jgi:hypothetical protein